MGPTLLSQRCIGCSLGTVLEVHQELGLGRKTRPPPQRNRKTGQAAEAGGGRPCAQRSAGGRGPTAGPEQDEGRRAPREPCSPPVLTAHNAGPLPPVPSAPHTSALHTLPRGPHPPGPTRVPQRAGPHLHHASPPPRLCQARPAPPRFTRSRARPWGTTCREKTELSLSEQLSWNHTGALSGS